MVTGKAGDRAGDSPAFPLPALDYGAGMVRSIPALLLPSLTACLLSACGQADNDPGPGGVTVGDARALDRAAARIEERRGPMPGAASPAIGTQPIDESPEFRQ